MGKGSGSSESAEVAPADVLLLVLSLLVPEEELLHEFRSFLLGEFPMVHQRKEERNGGGSRAVEGRVNRGCVA